ncbi:type IV toxin-antitoxin system AbiEi family antitoxin domain-containing protein [Mycobacterium sp. NPDC003449]
MNDFEPIEWAMRQTGITVAEVVALILNARAVKTNRGPNQMERLVEFVNSEFDVRAEDVVARGICEGRAVAQNLLSRAHGEGRIDRIARGVYAPKGTNDGA